MEIYFLFQLNFINITSKSLFSSNWSVIKLLSKRWWIPTGAGLEGPKFEPEGPRAEVGFPTLATSIHTKHGQMQMTQEAQLSPSDRAMRLVSSNLANYHATVQKLFIRQVLTETDSMKLEVSLEAMCHKQTDDGRVVYITCIPTTCCGEIFSSPQCRNCSRDPDHTHLGNTHSSQD